MPTNCTRAGTPPTVTVTGWVGLGRFAIAVVESGAEPVATAGDTAPTPLIVAETPPSCRGRGALPADWVTGASCEPKTVRTIPGAKARRKDAPLAILEINGGPDPRDITVTLVDAVAAL